MNASYVHIIRMFQYLISGQIAVSRDTIFIANFVNDLITFYGTNPTDIFLKNNLFFISKRCVILSKDNNYKKVKNFKIVIVRINVYCDWDCA